MENPTSSPSRHVVRFHGRTGKYFSIWLVNLLLSIVTLGIYSAWATVRTRRYFYTHTEIDGDRFDYHARPMDILKGRVIVFCGILLFMLMSSIVPQFALLFALAFIALLPWFMIRSWRYNALMSSFRGIRFNYRCRVGRAYWTMYLCPLLLVLALYVVASMVGFVAVSIGNVFIAALLALLSGVVLLVGGAVIQGIVAALNHDLYVNNMAYGTQFFTAQLSKKRFVNMVLMSFLIMLPFLLFAGLSVGSLFLSLLLALLQNVSDPAVLSGMIEGQVFALFSAVFAILVGALVSSVWLMAAQRNYVFAQTSLGANLRLISTMRTWSCLGIVLGNALIIVCTLGLGIPVAKVRLARYLAESTAVEGDMSLSDITAHHDSTNNAIAEEVVAAFDLNPGI